MTASLFPELPKPVTEELYKRLSSLAVEEAFHERQIWHEAATYAATGGSKVRPSVLTHLQQELDHLARQHGYPDLKSRHKTDFDAEAGKLLYEQMQMTPSEASRAGVWNFVSCILVPDLVRWRFPGTTDERTPEDRFHENRRPVRHTFGRLWWRAYTLNQSGTEAPFEFLKNLGEDELVQIMERTAIAASPFLAKQICRSFLKMKETSAGSISPDLFRDAMKRLRRLLPLLSFDALEEPVLKDLIDRIFRDAAASLPGKKKASRPEAIQKL